MAVTTLFRRMSAMLQVAVVLNILVGAQAQVVEFGACGEYQSSLAFNEEYITKMTEEEGGYVMALTSGRPYSCQSLTLHKNNTFKYSTHDAFNVLRNYTEAFTANVSTFTSPGNIKLRLPPGVFGSDIFGNLQLNVLMAEPEYLIAVTCMPMLGVARAEQVIAFVPRSSFTVDTARTLNKTLNELNVPTAAHLSVVPQDCDSVIRTAPNIIDIYNLLISFGIDQQSVVPPQNDSGTGNVSHSFYSALAEPTSYAIPSVFNSVLQSIAKSQAAQNNKIVQSSLYAKPSAYNSVGPSAGYVPQSPQVNYVPPISYAQPPHYLNSVQPAGFASPSGLVNSAPSIAYAQPISQANIAPVAYAQPFGYPNSVSPAFVQPALAQHSGNVPSAAFAQQSGNIHNLPSSTFPQQSGNIHSVPSATFAQQSGNIHNLPSSTFAQQSRNIHNLPSSTFAQQSGNIHNIPSAAYVQQSRNVHSVPSAAYVQEYSENVYSVPSAAYVQEYSENVYSVPSAGYGQQSGNINTPFTSYRQAR